ncbi:MAG: hypothetical protein U5K51_10800 [Flavobacteriaceae bacterium]|nr:hypothetical protein [Flavobacteriaceae bacterium]
MSTEQIDLILTTFFLLIAKDPFDLESKDPYKQREMDKFQKSQEENGINMAVTMFMVDALKFFEAMSSGGN